MLFYDRYGVEEYYQYDPESNCLNDWLRNGEALGRSLEEVQRAIYG
ncbi:hypothetical protein J5X98_19525 [Leptothermofonsia sichuanensis E412]|nr:hypothetical protein [Leptothermofonsia sichuanensis]QZZ19522.1 hypothetical protein J5X98_19525 [Leptothermofonsia sichuanensis E412]